jgi:tetratricopeptide (TPR) repeat protein
LFVALPAVAQHGTNPFSNGRIHVQVRLPDGSAAPNGILVELELQNTQMIRQEQTDSSGKCEFVPPGSAIYLVRAKQAGYYDAVVAVDLQNTPTGLAFLVLKPKPDAAPDEAPPEVPKNPSGSGRTVSAVDLAVPAPALKEFDLSRQALQNHDLEGGIAHLKKAIEIHEQFPQAYTLLGMAYNEQKKWGEGQAALEKAIQQNPKAAEAYVQLGSALIHQKDFAGAEKALNQGLQLDPAAQDSPMAHYTLATAYFADGHWKDAEPHAAKTIAAHPEFAMTHWLMAQIMLKKGDGQGAINEFETYLKLDPNGPAAPAVRAVIPKIQAVIQRQKLLVENP